MNLPCKFPIEKSEQKEIGNLIVPEKQASKTNGIILFNIRDKIKLHQIVLKNPFNIYDISEYELLEFLPNKSCEELKFIIGL